jgi:DNA polymerase III delta subunit
MITILHGDDTAASRNYFLALKKEQPAPISFQGESLNLTDLIQATQGGGLFGSTKSVFIEDFFSKKKIEDYEKFIAFLNKNTSLDIVFWEGKELTRKTLSEVPKSTVRQFQIPKIIFSFVDSLKPRDSRIIVSFHELLKHSEPEFILFMLIRQFRLLLALSDMGEDAIDEVKRLSSWQISKLQKQRSFFSLPRLKKVYQKLHVLDKESKTGLSNKPLSMSLDLLFLDIMGDTV